MIQIWLLCMFLITLRNVLLRKYKFNVLSCGMVGYCGETKADVNVLKLLLMYNLERGEDSTGWAINNKITKDTEKVTKFLTKNKLEISDEDENYTFIAHARKASSGARWKKELAHPFGMYKGGTEKDNYDLILAMNGTLTDTTEFAKHFETKYIPADNSDTQILATIMAKLGEKDYVKALERYNGAATLLFFTPKYPNTLMVYKDSMRPLFFWQKAKNEMYISSLEESLEAVGADKKDIHSFEDEHLYRINKGKITIDKKIIRDPIKYKAPVNVYNHSNYEGEYGRTLWEGGSKTKDFRESNKSNNGLRGNTVNFNDFSINSTKERKGNYIFCNSDKYYRNGHALSSFYTIGSDGKIQGKENDPTAVTAYFIAGYLMRDKTAYDTLTKKFYDGYGNLQLKLFKSVPLSELCDFIAFPVIGVIDGKQQFLLNSQWSKKVSQPGDKFKYVMPYTEMEYELTYTGEVITRTNMSPIKICNWTSAKRVTTAVPVEKPQVQTLTYVEEEDYKDLEVGEPFVKYVNDLIRENDSVAPMALYVKVRNAVWRANASVKLMQFFVKKLLDLLELRSAVSTEEKKEILDKGVLVGYNLAKEGEFQNDIIFILKIYKNILSEDVLVNAETDISEQKEDLNDQKVNAADISDREVVAHIESVNEFYPKQNFKDDFINTTYDDISTYMTQYCSDYNHHSTETRHFYEGILLCLLDIGKMTHAEFCEVVAATEKDLASKTTTLYNNFYKEMDKVRDNVEKLQKKGKNESKVVLEDEGNSTEEDTEKDRENGVKDIMDAIAQELKDFGLIPDKLMTPRLRKIQNTYIEIFERMDSELINGTINVK